MAKKKPARKSRTKSAPMRCKTMSEQRPVIVERMNAIHTPITIRGKIDRPDFYVTSEVRATSDPLWRHLAGFRRRLMGGGTYTPMEWQSLLIDIRFEAHEAGLRPNLGDVEWIVASLDEARKGDPAGQWQDDPNGWSKVVLTESGVAGWIELVDLLKGFAGTDTAADRGNRVFAIAWAESWMNARERQLCEPKLKAELKEALGEVFGERAGGEEGGGEREHPASSPALTPADWAFLTALNEAGTPLLGVELAAKAGYTDFRRPTRRLIDYGLATKPSLRSGFEITAAGKALVQMRS